MADKRSFEPIAIKLDREKDADIIEFLEDAPKTYIIKKALRLFMEADKAVHDRIRYGINTAGVPQESGNKVSSDEIDF